MSLDQRGRVMAEYVWIDSNGGTRSKTKVCLPLVLRLDFRPSSGNWPPGLRVPGKCPISDLSMMVGCGCPVRIGHHDKPCARGFFSIATRDASATIRIT